MPRLIISLVCVLGNAILFGSPTAALDATPAAEDSLNVLAVQSFTSGRIEPNTEVAGFATLTFAQAVGDTLYFSERPGRVVGTLSTESFLELLAIDSADPPNAALIAEGPAGNVVVVLELLDADIDAVGTLTYQVRVLADVAEVDLELDSAPLTELTEPLQFETSHLIVDGLSQHKDNPT